MSAGPRRIGVLGGMGPEATVLFMQKIVSAVQAGDDADHIPLLVDNNTQVPSRIKAIIEKTGDDPGPVLVDMARGLERAGAEALVMPCNTAHFFAPRIVAASRVPFLNMVTLSAAQASGHGARIGILGSPALQITGLFESALGEHGVQGIFSDHQPEVLDLIRTIKARGPDDSTLTRLRAAAQGLITQGADAIMICCTEFSLQADQLALPIPVFDTLHTLVAASVDFAKGGGR